ncbi:class I SAM-dependent methyltransferase [Bosea massiliensis]|uniref:Class I SAM-dependent methyltransferase n=1 Tax=Bosea massiliensis TaxID=151419 RepID=A0ABW0PC28_9HYPH
MADQDLRERQREHFNSIAGRYQAARRNANHLLLKDLMWAHALRGMDRFRGQKVEVLEPLCGFADGKSIIERYLCDNVEYSGYDYSEKVIELLKDQHPQINCWTADATKFDPLPGHYDIVILLGGLHHVPDYAALVVEKSARALKPGGIFINLEPTSGNVVSRKIREAIYRRNSLFDERTERDFGCGELFAMFENAGLRRLRITHPGLLSYVLYYNPDAFPRLNLGGLGAVRRAFSVDKPFLESAIGRFFSFATLSVWERPLQATSASG